MLVVGLWLRVLLLVRLGLDMLFLVSLWLRVLLVISLGLRVLFVIRLWLRAWPRIEGLKRGRGVVLDELVVRAVLEGRVERRGQTRVGKGGTGVGVWECVGKEVVAALRHKGLVLSGDDVVLCARGMRILVRVCGVRQRRVRGVVGWGVLRGLDVAVWQSPVTGAEVR